MQRIALLFHTPTWNKSKEIEKIWDPISKESTEILGTAGEATATLDACRRRFTSKQLNRRQGPFTGKIYDWFSEIERILSPSSGKERLLGHYKHVSYLGTNAISLGYVRKKHSSGYMLERLEALNTGLVVLRLHGVLISAYPISIGRHESNGRMTIC